MRRRRSQRSVDERAERVVGPPALGQVSLTPRRRRRAHGPLVITYRFPSNPRSTFAENANVIIIA
jgi:hypothetical protein